MKYFHIHKHQFLCALFLLFSLPAFAGIRIISSLPASEPTVCDGSLTVEVSGDVGIFEIIIQGPGYYDVKKAIGITTFNNLCAGDYELEIKNAYGCPTFLNAKIESCDLLELNETITPATCDQNNGSIIFDIENNSNLTFLWGNGATTQNRIDIGHGFYDLTVTDSEQENCEYVRRFEVEEGDLVVNHEISDPCLGNVNLIIEEGFEPFSFLWSNGETTANVVDLPPGSHSVTISDNYCSIVKTIDIDDNELVIDAYVRGTEMHPLSDGDWEKGAIDLTVISGTPPYTFNWSNGATTEDINSLSEGNYYVTVTDANGCQVYTSYRIVLCDVFDLHIYLPFENIELEQNQSLSIEVRGSNGPFEFAWEGPNGFTANTQSISGLEVGEYCVTATDFCGTTRSLCFPLTSGECNSGRVTFTAVRSCFEGGGFSGILLEPDAFAFPNLSADDPFYEYKRRLNIYWHNGEVSRVILRENPNGDRAIVEDIIGIDHLIVDEPGEYCIFAINGLGCKYLNRPENIPVCFSFSLPEEKCKLSPIPLRQLLPDFHESYSVYAQTGKCEICGNFETGVCNNNPEIMKFQYEPNGDGKNPCRDGGTLKFTDETCNEITIDIESNAFSSTFPNYDIELGMENGECEYPCGCLFSEELTSRILQANDVPFFDRPIFVETTIIDDCNPDIPECTEYFSFDADNCTFDIRCAETGDIEEEGEEGAFTELCFRPSTNTPGSFDVINFCSLVLSEEYVEPVHTPNMTPEGVDPCPSLSQPLQDNSETALNSPQDIKILNQEDGTISFIAIGQNPNNQHAMLAFYDKNFRGYDNKTVLSRVGATSNGKSITVTRNNQLYMSGSYHQNTMNSSFITKFTQDGITVWGKQFDAMSKNKTQDISATLYNHFLATGSFEQSIALDDITLYGEQQDIFLARYAATGDLIWASKAGGTGKNEALSVDSDAAGNIYITGYVQGNTRFEHLTANTSNEHTSFFMAKYSQTGFPIWLKTANNPGYSCKESRLVVDGNNDILVTGEFKNQFTVDNVTLSSNNNRAVFVSKYNTESEALWTYNLAEVADPSDSIKVTEIVLNQDNSFLVSGHFTGAATFMNGTTLTSRGGSDIFIARLDSNGNIIWIRQQGQINDEFCHSITTDGINLVAYTGEYRQSTILEGRTFEGNGDELTGFVIGFRDDCSENLELHQNPIPSNLYKANETISTTGNVAPNNAIALQAGEQIHFQPGFHAQADSYVHASIEEAEDCDDSQNNFQLAVEERQATEEALPIPTAATLRCYPNPFNQSTTIAYELPQSTTVDIAIYGMRGEKVAQLLSGENLEQGQHQIQFPASGIPTGIYYLVLRAGKEVLTEKLVVIGR